MIPGWKDFLSTTGAELNEDCVAHYGNLRRELSVAITGNVFADLSHYGLISVHGEDAESFLQNQLTNDVRVVDDQHSQLSGYCNPKGRLLATFRIFRRADTWYLCLPISMIETLIKKLRMYILNANVTIDEASDSFVHLGLSGKQAQATLKHCLGAVPQKTDAVVQTEDSTAICVPGIHPSFEIFTTVDQARALWEHLNVQSAPIGADAWQLLDIEAGIPVIYPATSEAFVPQMVNFQLIDGVNFKKGCFPGQEIVARMQYLGKIKRRMYKVRIENDACPVPGDEMYSLKNAEQSIGKVVSAAPHPDGGYSLLGVLQISSAEGDAELRLNSADGSILTVQQLPYTFPDDQ